MNVPDRIRDKKRETELEAVSLKDEHGLYLEILPTGKKVWRMRYWINQKEGVLKLGEYPLTGLKEARVKRDEARKLVESGKKPPTPKEIAIQVES